MVVLFHKSFTCIWNTITLTKCAYRISWQLSPRPARSSPAPSGCRPACSTGSGSPDRWAMATAGSRSHALRSAVWRRPAGPTDGTGREWPASCPAAAGSGWRCRPQRSVWASLCHPERWPHPTKKDRKGLMKQNRQRWTDARNLDMPGFTFRRVNTRETGCPLSGGLYFLLTL